jgi:hypothetical protein
MAPAAKLSLCCVVHLVHAHMSQDVIMAVVAVSLCAAGQSVTMLCVHLVHAHMSQGAIMANAANVAVS